MLIDLLWKAWIKQDQMCCHLINTVIPLPYNSNIYNLLFLKRTAETSNKMFSTLHVPDDIKFHADFKQIINDCKFFIVNRWTILHFHDSNWGKKTAFEKVKRIYYSFCIFQPLNGTCINLTDYAWLTIENFYSDASCMTALIALNSKGFSQVLPSWCSPNGTIMILKQN